MRMLLPFLAPLVTGCSIGYGGWAPPEQAVPTPAGLIDATDPQALTEIIARRDTGYWARDDLRDPVIRAETQGVAWDAEFYGCARGRDCTDIRFVARAGVGEKVKRDRLARWNAAHRFGKVSVNGAGQAELEMNLVLAGGVTRQNFDLTLDWWLIALHSFQREFGG